MDNADMREVVNEYWSGRAGEFVHCREQDMEDEQKGLWKNYIRSILPRKEHIKALDLGTGVGFYAFLLTELGAEATGVDYSAAMLAEAQKLAEKRGYSETKFMRMDAHHLEFPDNSFDFVISRNMTWTVPDPEQVYVEIIRVLAPGGSFAIFDGNWGNAYIRALENGVPEQWKTEEQEKNGDAENTDLMRISEKLYISRKERPAWDAEILLKHGISKIYIDRDFEDTVPAGDYRNTLESRNRHSIFDLPEYQTKVFMVRGFKK